MTLVMMMMMTIVWLISLVGGWGRRHGAACPLFAPSLAPSLGHPSILGGACWLAPPCPQRTPLLLLSQGEVVA